MIFSQINDYSLFTGCRYPSPWEFCSRVPLTLSSPPRMTSYEAWPHLKVRRERVERRPVVAALIDQRWFQGWPQCDSGTRPAERPSQFMGRELSLATCYPICNWVTLLWVPSYRVMNLEQEEMTEIMAWDRILMGFRKPWQSHMNNDLCMYTETNPV